MKAIMVMFDSLNRRMLAPYGCTWVDTPNFRRLAERAVTLDNCYAGSTPCMPARRELHTGRYNFLHRSWGPLEPFDDSMPEILKQSGVYTHLVSDHYHYWEEGGANYHTRYSSWEIVRGQEGDTWKAHLGPLEIPEQIGHRDDPQVRQHWVNREYMPREEQQPQPQTFALGLDFVRTNAREDNWFLQIETFDPHEPFFSPQRFKDLYPHDYHGPEFFWPPYTQVQETPEQVRHCRYEYAALVSMCDHYLGRVLDLMDELNLWKDTLLIVNTDHGFLLGEHQWWGKIHQPFYDELVHTPLFIWDPRCGAQNSRRQALVQTIDLPPTLLEYFGRPIPKDMQGRPLRDTVAADAAVRQAALYGLFGGQTCCTDGRYTYLRSAPDPAHQTVYEYTLMPSDIRHTFDPAVLRDMQLAEPFGFTKGCRTLRIPGRAPMQGKYPTELFDLQTDPGQEQPMNDPAVEKMMVEHLVRLMRETDAPREQYERMGLPIPRGRVRASGSFPHSSQGGA